MGSVAADRSPASARPAAEPRSARIHRAIVDATIELLAEVGYGALTIEGVAARAGVSRPAVYRRWRSKRELVAESLGVMAARMPVPDTGDTRRDLIEVVGSVADVLANSPGGAIERDLIAEAPRSPELAETLQGIIRSRRAAIAEVLRRGAERGDLRSDLDPEFAFDLVMGPVHYRFLVTRGSLDRGFIEQSADAILGALGVSPPGVFRRGAKRRTKRRTKRRRP